MSGFKRAVKGNAYLRLALAGPAGSGKTYTALTLATALAAGKGPVALIDTERGSASKYADLFAFDVLELESFHPDRYVEAIADAVAGGYAVVVVDSMSHAWTGKDGMLELVDNIAKRDKIMGLQAWAKAKPTENRFVEALTGSRIHIIGTMRSKVEYVVEQNAQGKATPRKVGTAPVQRDGFEYEFDVFGEMTQDNDLVVQKTRCPALTGQVIHHPGKPLADTLRAWLEGTPTHDEPTPLPIAEALVRDSWKDLQQRAAALGITDMRAHVEAVTGKTDKGQYTAQDRKRVAADIARREQAAPVPHALGELDFGQRGA